MCSTASHIILSCRNLDLSQFCIGQKDEEQMQQPPIYDLYAVINHYGGMIGGHYTAYARLPSDKNSQRSDVGESRRPFPPGRVGPTRLCPVLFSRPVSNLSFLSHPPPPPIPQAGVCLTTARWPWWRRVRWWRATPTSCSTAGETPPWRGPRASSGPSPPPLQEPRPARWGAHWRAFFCFQFSRLLKATLVLYDARVTWGSVVEAGLDWLGFRWFWKITHSWRNAGVPHLWKWYYRQCNTVKRGCASVFVVQDQELICQMEVWVSMQQKLRVIGFGKLIRLSATNHELAVFCVILSFFFFWVVMDQTSASVAASLELDKALLSGSITIFRRLIFVASAECNTIFCPVGECESCKRPSTSAGALGVEMFPGRQFILSFSASLKMHFNSCIQMRSNRCCVFWSYGFIWDTDFDMSPCDVLGVIRPRWAAVHTRFHPSRDASRR